MTTNPQKHLYELLEEFATAMLVSRDGAGALHARPMAIAHLEPDAAAFFATDKRSPKIAEIESDPQVLVTFQSTSRFASLWGTASISSDRALIHRLWSEEWRAWFPAGKDDPNLVILKVEPTQAEFWDNSGLEGIKYLFEGVKAIMQGRRHDPNAGEHAKLTIGR